MAQPPVKISLATTLAGFERNPSFSPDGNEIAFVHFDTDTRDLNIFVKTLGDERVVQLTHTPPPGASDCPSWSPDGTTIAYNRSIETSATTSVAAIFLMTARGGSQRQLRPVSSDASCQMSWAPDSKSLAYGDAPPGQNPGIFLIPSSGSPVRRLTTAPPTTTDGDPAFSPDGTEVASIRWSSSTTSDLYRASTTNGQITRVTVLNRRVVSPVWTSDGKRLIFGINGGFWGTNALFSVATTSAEPESLPFISSPSVFTPALSRQEDKLAFATGFFDTNIWNIPLREPAAPHSIAPATQDKWPSPNKVIVSTRMEMQPQLSPNGTRLAYVSDRDGAMALWLSKPDGSDPIRLASAPLGGTPDWSPDGNNIVFDTAESGSGEIYVTSADGGIPTQITSGHFENGAATWSADGKWIYFDSKRSGHWEIWKTAFPGKNDAVQVTTHGGGYAQEATDGKFIYYQKPASDAISQMLPQIWRMASGGGAEDPVVSVGEPMSDCCSWFWRVTAEGIYFIDNAARPLPVIKRFTFATGNVKVLAQLEKKTGAVPVCRSLPTVAQRSKLNWTIRAAIFCWLNTSIEICYSPAFAANASTTTMFCRNCCGRPCRSSKYAGVL
jgi:Tol biopolymer transport system component